ncbi:MAG: cyclic nucleotide-binding domain-containing protein [Gammaproteobacteria bacterium]|nr:cyclic nucleotide-binding domain-containing protein [Gammaproteobacteria bacterium]
MDAQKQKFQQQIKSLIPISGMAAQYQNEVVHKAEILKFKKKQTIFKQGDVDPYSYYLLEGELELEANGSLLKTVAGGSMDAQSPLSQLQPRPMSARSKGKSTVLRIPRELMDRLLTMDDPGPAAGAVEVSEVDVDDDEGGDWMTRMLQSELFSRIPPANIQRLFAVMETVPMKAGSVVVEQGSPGDYYYIVQSGRCEVSRKAGGGGKPIKLAELGGGDSFGEEALISGAKRNATVTMLSDGELVRLTKEDFVELIKKPSLESVDLDTARSLVVDGACWLDLRFPEEHSKDGIEGSVNLPLNQLRTEFKNLEADRVYITYCDSGARSSAGAFLLAQNGFDVRYLAGGLIENGMASSAAAAPPPAPDPEPAAAKPEPKAEPKPEPKPEPKAKAEPAAAKPEPKPEPKPKPKPEAAKPAPADEPEPVGAGSDIAATTLESAQAEVRAAELAEDVAKADARMEEAMRVKAEAEAARRSAEKKLDSKNKKLEAKAAQAKKELEQKAAEAQATLEEAKRERIELEKARRAAEADAEKKRAEEEQRLEKLKSETEARLQAEREKLEAEYAKQADELAKLQEDMKLKAKADLEAEREAMERKASAANRELEKAEKAKFEAEEIERRIREQSEAAIRAERERLEAEFARAAEQLHEAQREREMAELIKQEAAKRAAQKIAEEKVAQELARQEDEARLEAERLKLKEEAKRLQKQLEEAKQAKAKIEAAAKLRAKKEAEAAKRKKLKEQEAKVKRDMIAAQQKADARAKAASAQDDELARANAMLRAAEEAHRKAEQAQQDLEDTQSWKKSELDSLRAQMEAELAEFMIDNPTPDKNNEEEKKRAARMQEFEQRRKAEEKKRADADSMIASEIASQLQK